MPRNLRHCDPDTYYLLTNRTVDAQYFLTPDPMVRKVVLGVLAKWAQLKNTEIVCFCILSNHFHIIARFPDRNMDDFMEQFQKMVARRINIYRGRSGHFWESRYDDTSIIDDTMLKEKLAYVVNNAVHHRLVARAEHWPGICSISWHKSGEPVEGQWLNKSERSRLRRKGRSDAHEAAWESFSFEMELPAALGGETDEERRQNILELVEQDRQRLAKERQSEDAGVSGERAIRERNWRDSPHDPEENPSALCAASDPDERQEYRDKRRHITDKYREALAKWRNNEPAQFPIGTYPPGWDRCVDNQEYRDPPDETDDDTEA